MRYDPVKRTLGRLFNRWPWSRILFYHLLNLLLLRSWHIRKEIRKWKKQAVLPASVLDAGMGFGQYSYYLASLSGQIRVMAVDIDPLHVDDCRAFLSSVRRGKQVECREDDLTRFTDPGRFDLVLCVDVMEHIEDDGKVFRNLHQSMKPGSLLLISTPSDRGGSEVHGEKDASFIEEHVRDGYSITDISEKLFETGFEKVECRYTYGPFGHISWLLSIKYPILLLNFSKFFLILLLFYYLLTYPICLILNYLDLSFQQKTGTGLVVSAWK